MGDLEPGAVVMMIFSVGFLLFTGWLLMTSVNKATKRKAAGEVSDKGNESLLADTAQPAEG